MKTALFSKTNRASGLVFWASALAFTPCAIQLLALMERACVIGGGLGGLAAAVVLRAHGADVTVLEKNEQVGGKCNLWQWEGFSFDTGPSLLTLPFVLDELFSLAGKRREDYLELVRLQPACRYFFPDGLQFDAPGSLEGFREAVAATFPGEVDNFDRFIRYCRQLWEVSGPMFLFNPFTLTQLFKVPPRTALAGLGALRPWTLQQAVRHYFKDPWLVQLFERYATYNGSDPRKTPATFNVISYVEMAFGSWHCLGGMYALVEALAQLACDLGVEIRTQCPVEAVRFDSAGQRIKGVILQNGEFLKANRVVINADAVTALTGPLLANHPKAAAWQSCWAKREPSSSGYVLLLALDKTNPALTCHNIFFCRDYAKEFNQLFREPAPLDDPTLYISVPGKVDSTQSPAGKEGWFVLANAPSLQGVPSWPDDYGDALVALLEQRGFGFGREQVLWQHSLPPTFLQERYAAWHGSIYGPSSNSLRSAFFRVPNKGAVRGLAFAGGSAHPGGGIPLALTSGRLAADSVMKTVR